MLKIWVDVWTALVRQLFIRQKLEALNNSQRTSITAPEVAQVDAEPVTVVPSSRSASSRKVAGGAEIIPNSNPNRRRTHGQPVLPPAIEVVDERDLRVSRHSLRSVRKSAGQYPPTRLAHKDSKPLPPLPGNNPTNPNLLTVPSANTRRPAAPRLSRTSTVINLRSSKVSGRLSTMAEEVVFRDVMKAAYDYAATAEDELTMKEDQLLYLLGNLDDDWAKVQVHTPLELLSEAEPAAGLVPSAYIEPAPPLYRAVALYDYEPNGEGEVLMKENEKMSVYLKEDDWILVKIDRKGTVSKPAIGYVPANYVEEGEGDGEAQEEAPVAAAAVSIPPTPGTPTAQADNAERAAAASAKLKGDPVDIWNVSEIDKKGKKKKGTLGVGNGSIFFASEADKAPVQKWQVSTVTSVSINEDKHKHVNLEISGPSGDLSLEFGAGSRDEAHAIVDKVERSKRLAIGESSPPSKSPEAPASTIKSPTPSAPNGGRYLPPPAHPGLSPSPSGKSKGVRWDTAPPAEIPQAVQSDEESEGHKSPAAAPPAPAPPPRAGGIVAVAMYDFEADGEDELTVKEGEKLTIVDKEESDEWWKCRNSKGKEGVVPASYLELESADEGDDNAAAEAAAEAARAEAARKEQEQAAAAAAKAKRLADERRKREQEQEAREAQERQEQERQEQEEAEAREAEAQKQKEERERRAREARRREAEAQAQASSKSSTNGTPKNSHNRGQSKDLPGRPSLEKPKPTNTRIWHDRSGQFKVEAQFLGVHNNKVRLHKANGVIIEVPEEKMSATDMEYIRKAGRNPTSPTSPDEDNIPLGTLPNRRSTQGPPSSSRSQAPLRKSHIDWFEFFLNAGCDLDDCTRYATTFEREKIDEAILPDLKPETLRGLNLREGDIIRVMKQIEQRGWKVASPRSDDPKVQEQMKKDAELAARLQEEEFGRKTPVRNNTASPGLFAGPKGTLKNNTRRGRPAPTKTATLTVDASGIASASEQLSRTSTPANVSSPTTSTASGSKPTTTTSPVADGFGDPWTPRPTSAKPASTAAAAISKSAPPPVATPTPPPLAPPVQPAPPPPPPPAPPATQPLATPTAQAPAAQPTMAPKLATEFDVLAKLGTMRPPSAPAQPMSAPLAPTISPPPVGFQQGMGMGSSPAPMGNLLQAQATGVLSPLQAAGGPRAPYAPVPQNEGLLKPLIPTTTGFNSFVPTRPGTAPATGFSNAGATPSFLTSQPTGFNPSFNPAPQPTMSPLVPNPTGFAPSASPFQPASATSSGFSTASYASANSAFQAPSPLATQPTGFGNAGAGSGFGSPFGGVNPGSNFLNAVSSQPTGMFTGPPNVNPAPDNNAPANVFAAMKAGSFANAAAPQSSDRYDALRPQPTGWNALGAGVQPQPTGFNPGFGAGLQPNPAFGQQAGFQQPMQTGFGQPGFGQPGFGGAPNQFGGFQR